MIDDGLLFHTNGNIEVFVRIQDGTERIGDYRDESEAIQAYQDADFFLNRNKNRMSKKYRVVSRVTEYVERFE